MTLTLAIVIGILVLLVSGLPMAYSLGLLGLTGLFFLSGGTGTLDMLPVIAYSTASNFVMTALPLFILMGEIIFISGMSSDLFETATKWFGRLPGGLALASVVACAMFAAMCGSSVACAASVGLVAIPEMTQRGYDRKLALGVIAGGGALGILIPPSIPMILYCVVTEQSVGKLFIAGVIPGILMTGIFLVYIAIVSVRRSGIAPRGVTVSWKDKFLSLSKLWSGLVVIFFVMGGIYLGVVTPTEAAAVGAVCSLLIGFIVYRKIGVKNLQAALLRTVQTNAMIFMIIIGAMIFGHLLTILGVTQTVTNFVTLLPVSRWTVMVLINILLLVLGCFLDVASLILLTTPIIFPVVTTLGFDPIWFGVIMIINMEMAVITPPLAMNLFVVQSISGAPMTEVIQGVLPFVVLMAITLAILMVCPSLALWLPSLMR